MTERGFFDAYIYRSWLRREGSIEVVYIPDTLPDDDWTPAFEGQERCFPPTVDQFSLARGEDPREALHRRGWETLCWHRTIRLRGGRVPVIPRVLI